MSPFVEQASSLIRHGAGHLDDPEWHVTVARVLECLPELQRGRQAQEALVLLRSQHTPVRWAEDSDTVVCAVCTSVAWPCDVVEAIDQAGAL